MNYKNILVNQEGSLCIITINRPDKLNALNIETIAELGNALQDIADGRRARAIIITGSGSKAFVAGADISEFADFEQKAGRNMSAEGQKQLFDRVEQLSVPVIAAVNGFALGGGLELALSCHIRIASDNARMGLPEVGLGVIPGYGGTQRLPQIVGKGRALEMILTGDMVLADEALRIGLVNHVVSQEELMNKCKEVAEKIMSKSPIALAAAIKSVNAGFKDGVDGFEAEIDAFGSCFGSDDFKEGTSAFLAKRKPSFKG